MKVYHFHFVVLKLFWGVYSTIPHIHTRKIHRFYCLFQSYLITNQITIPHKTHRTWMYKATLQSVIRDYTCNMTLFYSTHTIYNKVKSSRWMLINTYVMYGRLYSATHIFKACNLRFSILQYSAFKQHYLFMMVNFPKQSN